MSDAHKKKLVQTNAAVLTAGMLASFVLPMITDSITDGRGNFLRAMAHIFPLICAMAFSCSLLGKYIDSTTDNATAVSAESAANSLAPSLLAVTRPSPLKSPAAHPLASSPR